MVMMMMRMIVQHRGELFYRVPTQPIVSSAETTFINYEQLIREPSNAATTQHMCARMCGGWLSAWLLSHQAGSAVGTSDGGGGRKYVNESEW